MTRRLLLVALGVLVLLTTPVDVLTTSDVPNCGVLPDEQDEEPLLRELLRMPGRRDADHDSPFFVALKTIATKQGWKLPEFGNHYGIAFPVGDGNDKYVVVALTGEDVFIPGRAWQHLFLLDAHGRLADELTCEINNRLMSEVKSNFFTEKGQGNSEVVVRFVPDRVGTFKENWGHDITHAGETRRFHWSPLRPQDSPEHDWARQGLCRVTVRDGKFVVRFPQRPR